MSSSSAYPGTGLQSPPTVHDAHWTPENSLGTAPQTGWNGVTGLTPAWVFVGGCLTQQINNDIVCEISPGATSLMSVSTVGATAQPKVYRANQAVSDITLDPYYRLLLRLRRRIVGGNPGADFGFELRCIASALGGNVGSGTGAGFSIAMDGAGGWRLRARQIVGGPLTLDQAIVWPSGDTTWHTWEYRILPATAARDAIFQVYANSTLLFSQAWAVAPFADYSGPGGLYRFVPALSAGAAGPTDTLLVRAARLIVTTTLPV